MTGKDELKKFKKMWTWLLAHPAHDSEYYLSHVLETEKVWLNACPLADSSSAENCHGCEQLWKSDQGNLCTDPDSPLFKWLNASIHEPDDRSYYASQVAVLAMKRIRRLEQRAADHTQRRMAA
ncbi:MAG: hypothetical protein ACWGOX_10145 [Desulforhopalus sp.]